MSVFALKVGADSHGHLLRTNQRSRRTATHFALWIPGDEHVESDPDGPMSDLPRDDPRCRVLRAREGVPAGGEGEGKVTEKELLKWRFDQIRFRLDWIDESLSTIRFLVWTIVGATVVAPVLIGLASWWAR